MLRQTTSGGACVNICAVQGALPSLGFGGVGQSGSGRHHGIEGFREFSNPRGVVVRGTGDLADAFLPPYGPMAQAIVNSVFDSAGQPGSTAHRQRLSAGTVQSAVVTGLSRRPAGPATIGPPRFVNRAARWVHDGRRLDMQGLADELGRVPRDAVPPRRRPRGAARARRCGC